MKLFSYKDSCSMHGCHTHIERCVKRKASLDYGYTAVISNISHTIMWISLISYSSHLLLKNDLNANLKDGVHTVSVVRLKIKYRIAAMFSGGN